MPALPLREVTNVGDSSSYTAATLLLWRLIRADNHATITTAPLMAAATTPTFQWVPGFPLGLHNQTSYGLSPDFIFLIYQKPGTTSIISANAANEEVKPR